MCKKSYKFEPYASFLILDVVIQSLAAACASSAVRREDLSCTSPTILIRSVGLFGYSYNKILVIAQRTDFFSVLSHCWLGHLAYETILERTYNV